MTTTTNARTRRTAVRFVACALLGLLPMLTVGCSSTSPYGRKVKIVSIETYPAPMGEVAAAR